MKELVSLFDALYSKLLLRDVFGKILPGAIVVFTISSSITCVDLTVDYISNMGFWFWVFFLGLAWLVAFGVQAFGEKTKQIKYHAWDDDASFYKDRYMFDTCVGNNAPEKQQLERLVVIKEACGNGYLAIIISALLIFLDKFLESGMSSIWNPFIKEYWHISLFAIFIIIFLRKMHFEHVERHHTYIKTILTSCEEEKNSPSNNALQPTAESGG